MITHQPHPKLHYGALSSCDFRLFFQFYFLPTFSKSRTTRRELRRKAHVAQNACSGVKVCLLMFWLIPDQTSESPDFWLTRQIPIEIKQRLTRKQTWFVTICRKLETLIQKLTFLLTPDIHLYREWWWRYGVRRNTLLVRIDGKLLQNVDRKSRKTSWLYQTLPSRQVVMTLFKIWGNIYNSRTVRNRWKLLQNATDKSMSGLSYNQLL